MSGYVFTDAERAAAREAVGLPPMQRVAALRAELESPATPAPAPAPPAPAIAPQLGRHTYVQLYGALAIIAVFLGVAIYAFWPKATAPTTTPRSAPTTAATHAAAIIPALTPLPTATASAVMVVGWAAPDGAVLGPVPLPPAATARFGDDWLGFPWQGGMVWIRRADWPTAPIAGLPDLTPPTPAPIVVWQPAPAAVSAPSPTDKGEMRNTRPAPPTRVSPYQMR